MTEFQPLNSQSAHGHHYDEVTQRLTIRYKSGDYVYHGVEPHHAEGLASAESPNAYLTQHIKPAHKAERL